MREQCMSASPRMIAIACARQGDCADRRDAIDRKADVNRSVRATLTVFARSIYGIHDPDALALEASAVVLHLLGAQSILRPRFAQRVYEKLIRGRIACCRCGSLRCLASTSIRPTAAKSVISAFTYQNDMQTLVRMACSESNGVVSVAGGGKPLGRRPCPRELGGDHMVLNAKVALFVCGVVGSAGIALMQPSDQPNAMALINAPVGSAEISREEFREGMAQQAHAAAERPFAAFAPTMRQ
jgi:hypothetical protein